MLYWYESDDSFFKIAPQEFRMANIKVPQTPFATQIDGYFQRKRKNCIEESGACYLLRSKHLGNFMKIP